MDNLSKGDVLKGTKRKFKEAWHIVVYIDGPPEAPLAVPVTHDGPDKFPCNITLLGNYEKGKKSYFISHLIEKLSEWGPYTKFAELTKEDIELVDSHISNQIPMKWNEYESYKKNGCPDHQNTTLEKV
jgi:hypothetical protein